MIPPVNRDFLDELAADDLRLMRNLAAAWLREVDDALKQLETQNND